jgi:threonine 3-dehydrogenase
MRAVVKARPSAGLELITTDIPPIGPRDVLVRVRATSLCGTDVHIYTWDAWAQTRIRPPRIIGHEVGGEVVEVGAEVTRVKPGDVVSAESHIACGYCVQCRHGQHHICANLQILGVDRDGTFADYVALPEENVWKDPPTMPFDVAAIQEPMGNAVYTALSGTVNACTVMVVGTGPIGLGAIAICTACGARAVYASDISPYRLTLAQRMGADAVFNPREQDVVAEVLRLTDGVGADVVLEMSGHSDAIRQAFQMLRKGGRISLLGLPPEPVTLDLANAIIFKGATVLGINGREMFRTWYQMSALQQSGKVDFSPLITHRFPLEEFDAAFEAMRSGICGKVVLIP